MYRLTHLAALLCCLFAFSNAYPQKTVDSLRLTLKNPKIHDTTKLYGLAYTMSVKYNEGMPEYYVLNDLMGKLAAKKYNEKTAPKEHHTYGGYLAAYYSALAIRYLNERNIVQSLACSDKSIALYKAGKYYGDMNFAIIAKANTYAKINEDAKAIDCIFLALKYFEKYREDTSDEGIATANSTLASLYTKQNKYDRAIHYSKKVMAYYNSKKDSTAQYDRSNAIEHSNCGTSYLRLKKYPEAMRYFEKALELARQGGDAMTASVVLAKMGMVRTEENKFDQAEAYFKQALAGDIGEVAKANAYIKMGDMYYRRKDFAQADHYLTSGLKISTELMILELQEQASDLLYKVSRANRNFEKALDMYELQDRLVDSTKAEASKNALAQKELQYAFEKKELNYKLASEKKTAAKNNGLIALSGVVLLLLLGGYFYYRNSKQKQAITLLEKDQIKQKLLISQMNPHFIFNSIQNIRGLIHENQNGDAVNYLDKFSRLTRQILENSNETYISLEEELEMTQNYLAIQQMLHQNRFDYSVEVDDSLDVESIFLPPMLTQPFIENAIKHGLSGQSSHGKIAIRFYLEDSKLYFEVIDNGSGFGSKKSENHKSMAMAITKDRLVHYTKNRDFIVYADNLKSEDQKITGAKVAFEIPYIYEN